MMGNVPESRIFGKIKRCTGLLHSTLEPLHECPEYVFNVRYHTLVAT